MKRLYTDTDKYARESPSAVVEAIHNAVRDLVRQRFASAGVPWSDFVFGAAEQALGADDFRAVEQQLLETGHRFDWSAAISPQERPEAYKPQTGASDDTRADFCFQHPEAPVADVDADGRAQRGVGDNVVRYKANLTGTARYVRSSERVLKWLSEGVPADTIAVIDDSGGTLTAPILEQFRGVICAGGTVRSHLGILTREYGIPCFMNAKIDGIREGDRIEMECTAKAKTAEDYQTGREATGRVWRLNGTGDR